MLVRQLRFDPLLATSSKFRAAKRSTVPELSAIRLAFLMLGAKPYPRRMRTNFSKRNIGRYFRCQNIAYLRASIPVESKPVRYITTRALWSSSWFEDQAFNSLFFRCNSSDCMSH